MKKKVVAVAMATAMMASSLAIGGATVYAADDSIVIGAVYPMTGDLADSGKTMQQGIDMAVEEINEAGGIDGQEVEVIYGDSKV